MEYYLIDHIAVTLLLGQYWALGSKKRWAFLLGVLGSIGMIAFGIMSASIPIIVGNIAFAAIGIRGWIKWGQEENK